MKTLKYISKHNKTMFFKNIILRPGETVKDRIKDEHKAMKHTELLKIIAI